MFVARWGFIHVRNFAARLPPFLDGHFQNLNTTSPLPLSDRVNNQRRQSPDKLERFHPRPARLFQDGIRGLFVVAVAVNSAGSTPLGVCRLFDFAVYCRKWWVSLLIDAL